MATIHDMLTLDAMVQSVAVDADGKFMAAINDKGNCYIWSLTGGHPKNSNGYSKNNSTPISLYPKQKLPAHKKYGLKCLFSPDSSLLATTSADGTVKLWSTTDFSLYKTLKQENSQRWVWDCSLSEDSHYIITASSDNLGRLWNVDKGEIIREYTGHAKAIVCLAFRDVKS